MRGGYQVSTRRRSKSKRRTKMTQNRTAGKIKKTNKRKNKGKKNVRRK